MIAPLMTCSARLPVYTLLIGAFIPRRMIGPFNLQGLTLFALYLVGVAGAMAVAFAIKRIFMRGDYHPLMLELPEYKWPNLRNLALGLWERTRIFLGRVGTVLLTLMVVLWFLASFPAPPPGATEPAISYSLAGRLGPCAAAGVRAHRLQLADLRGAGAGPGGARSGRGRAGHGLRHVGRRPERGRRAAAHPGPRLVGGHRAVAAGLVRLRAAVPVDAGGGPPRDQQLALSALMAGYLFALSYLTSFITYRAALAAGLG